MSHCFLWKGRGMHSGSIVQVIRNEAGWYEGDLVQYFKALFFRSQNIRHPYHNLRHMLHVAWLCHDAIGFYRVTPSSLTLRGARNLLIAALFHDFDHSGQFGNDDLNIERAVRGFRAHIAPDDERYADSIARIIRASEFPHKRVEPEDVQEDLAIDILRDADVSQALSVARLQQVIVGLASEWGKSPLEVLKAQKGFHQGLRFRTGWASTKFPPHIVEAKIREAEDLLAILEAA